MGGKDAALKCRLFDSRYLLVCRGARRNDISMADRQFFLRVFPVAFMEIDLLQLSQVAGANSLFCYRDSQFFVHLFEVLKPQPVLRLDIIVDPLPLFFAVLQKVVDGYGSVKMSEMIRHVDEMTHQTIWFQQVFESL